MADTFDLDELDRLHSLFADHEPFNRTSLASSIDPDEAPEITCKFCRMGTHTEDCPAPFLGRVIDAWPAISAELRDLSRVWEEAVRLCQEQLLLIEQQRQQRVHP